MPLSRPPIMRMRWKHLLFAHWPVDVNLLRPLIPDAYDIDTFDGSAWVGLVPFTMEDVSPRCLPRVPGGLRGLTDFHECNVRTYVTPRAVHRSSLDSDASRPRPGVWFFSLDAASAPAVWGARRFFSLPYFHARISLDRRGDVIDYAVDRLYADNRYPWEREMKSPLREAPRLRCRWRASDALPPSRPGELTNFLTERYALYTMKRLRDGSLAPQQARIEHHQWTLRRAELLSLDDSLVRAAGIAIDESSKPVLHHADEMRMRAWCVEPMKGG